MYHHFYAKYRWPVHAERGGHIYPQFIFIHGRIIPCNCGKPLLLVFVVGLLLIAAVHKEREEINQILSGFNFKMKLHEKVIFTP